MNWLNFLKRRDKYCDKIFFDYRNEFLAKRDTLLSPFHNLFHFVACLYFMIKERVTYMNFYIAKNLYNYSIDNNNSQTLCK